MKKISVVGVGTMGRGMVKNLAKNGYQVVAFTRSPEKIQDLRSETISIANKLDDVREVDVIITCLPSDQAMESLIFEKKLLDIVSSSMVVDSGTTSIDLTKKIAEECKKKNIEFLDAPVTGSKLGAENGTLTYMIGGEKSTYDKCLPLLQAMGKVHVHCGPVSYGQRAKLALNMSQAIILQGYLEALLLGLKNGVSLEAMQQVMENSAAKNGVGSFKLPFITQRDFDQHFMLKLMVKDLKMADQEINRLGMTLPLASQMSSIFEKSMDRELEDFSTIVKELEKHNNLILSHNKDKV